MAHYYPDDVIKLARANPGFGFHEFLKELHGKNMNRRDWDRKEGQVLRLFDIHKHETGEDLFVSLQDPEYITMVTADEYYTKVGTKYLPKGYGSRPGVRSGMGKPGSNAKNIPLSPQYFEWLDIKEIPEEEVEDWRGKSAVNIQNLFDYEQVIRLHDYEKMTVSQISKEIGISERRIEKFLGRMRDYDEHGVAYEWLGVMAQLWRIQEHRGKTHREDDLMMELRGIFIDYERDPVKVEAPSLEDINWIYQKLVSEHE